MMMNFANDMLVRSMIGTGGAAAKQRLIDGEIAQGFAIVNEADWLDPSEWITIVASQDGRRIRLVLLHAKLPGNGAFTRMVKGIWQASLTPVLVEPNQSLIDWAVRHGFKRRTVGKGRFRHHIWYPTGRS